MLCLVDDYGAVWPQRSHPICQWDTDDDPLEYAVWDRGFIRLQPSNCGLRVIFSPHRVRPRTIVAAYYIIAESQPRRVLLSYGCTSPTSEIIGTVGAAVRRIEEIVDRSGGHAEAAVVQRARPFDCRPAQSGQSIDTLLAAWVDRQARWTPELAANLQAAKVFDTGAIIYNPRCSDRLVNLHMGPGIDAVVGPRWRRIGIGKDIEEQPFLEIGRIMASLSRATLSDGTPRLHDVNLSLPGPNGTTVRRRFDRLILPWKGTARDGYVTEILTFKT